jgi:hypothetical protein
MGENLGRKITQHELYDRVKPLLHFRRDHEGRLLGMPAMALLYPSPTLASVVDPVELSLDPGGKGLPDLDAVLGEVEQRIRQLVASLPAAVRQDGREDERWYWAVPVLLDSQAWPRIRDWCTAPQVWHSGEGEQNGDDGSSFVDHLDQLVATLDGHLSPPLGRRPADLARVLAELALAAPGTCALRSLRRVAKDAPWDDPVLLGSAARIADGFRTLFNLPESIAVLRGADAESSYWRTALRHGLDGNLPALLDEQVHVLREALGLMDADASRRVTAIAAELADSLTIRSATLTADELVARGGKIVAEPLKFRSRFALRFGELRDEKTGARIGNVRTAFNSPFRPFILASTSIGQEGLDFHTWCHGLVHWNLPSNPVDLEQREGRVHRYKGHAVRKNVARALGIAALRGRWRPGDDPWEVLFAVARQERRDDLLTYWLFEVDGGARVERRVPLLPFSKETAHLARLKRGLALYRLVFGQPRQEDLLAHLAESLPADRLDELVAEWRIDLSPPR